MTVCCPACFDDQRLRENVFPSLNPSRGKCDFCGADDADVISPTKLADVFGVLVNIYRPDPHGKPLVDLLREDWRLFPDPPMELSRVEALLSSILENGDLIKQRFSPSETYTSQALAAWEVLRDELRYRNRYFLDKAFDTDRLEQLLAHLAVRTLPSVWYRARILWETEPYPIDEMGAPPKDQASHGRANPTGIPYLYLSSDPGTAASEVRPHTGEVACIADFKVDAPVTVIDLRDPRKLVSPFLLADPGAVGQLRADIPFLERLGSELTRPVLPRSAAIDYIPSQYLCEFIKKKGFDGVIYRSAVTEGINLALFDPTKATGGAVQRYSIKRVAVDIAPV